MSEHYRRNRAQQLFETRRVELNLTWEALGDLVGKAKSTVHSFINSPWPTLPDVEMVNKVADALNVSREIAHAVVVESAGYTASTVEFDVPEWLAVGWASLGKMSPEDREHLERVIKAVLSTTADANVKAAAKPRKRAPKKQPNNGR